MAKLTKVRQEFEEAYLGQAVKAHLEPWLALIMNELDTKAVRGRVEAHLRGVLRDAVARGHATFDVWEPTVIIVHDSVNVGFQLKDDWEPEQVMCLNCGNIPVEGVEVYLTIHGDDAECPKCSASLPSDPTEYTVG